MTTNITTFELEDANLAAGESTTLNLVFTTPVVAFDERDLMLQGVSIEGLTSTDNGQSWTATVTANDGFNGEGLIRIRANQYYNGTDGSSGDSFEYDFKVDTTAPIINAQTFNYDENLQPTAPDTEVVLGSVGASDNTSIASFDITAGNDNGYYAINDQGMLTLTEAGQADEANDFESGDNAFELTVATTDEAGNTSEAAITLNVNDVNEAPIAEDTTLTLDEDSIATGVLPIVNDPDANDTVTYSVAEQPENGSVTINSDGTYEYTPSPDYNGDDSFQYSVTDAGGLSNTYTVSATVAPINDAPILTGNLQADVIEGYFTTLTTDDINFNDIDNDGSAQTFTVSDSVNGNVIVDGAEVSSFTFAQLENGQVRFVHDGSDTAAASFSVSVDDGNEDNSDPVSQTFTLGVTPPPEIASISISDDNVDDSSENGIGSPTEISGVASNLYGTDYLYSGLVAVGENGVITNGALEGLTNDSTPTITVSLDAELLADGYQEIQVTRYVDDPIQGLIEDTIVATSANGLTSVDNTTFSFEDSLPEGDVNKVYRYEAQIVNVADRVTSDEAVEALLDTISETPVVDTYTQVENTNDVSVATLTGAFTEEGVVYVDRNKNNILDGDESWTVVNADGTWTLGVTEEETVFLNDQDNYEAYSDTPLEGEPLDTYMPLGFIDKAGNTDDETIEYYYFDEADGTGLIDADLSPADRPETASGGYLGDLGDTDGDGTFNVEMRFDQNSASQVILVEDHLISTGALAQRRFNVVTEDGNDTINILGNQYTNTGVYMGEGNDTYTSDLLFGSGNRESIVVDMGNGNNRVLITEDMQDAVLLSTIKGGDGDDLVRVYGGGVDRSTIDLGDGDNRIITADDIDSDSTILTGDGDDLLVIDDTSGVFNNRDLYNSTVNLGGGNNTIEILDGTVDRSEVTTGMGNDSVTIGVTGQSFQFVARYSTFTLGAGDDEFVIYGRLNDTTINAGEGDDVIAIGDVFTNNNTIDGGEGYDKLYIEEDATINISEIIGVEEIHLNGFTRDDVTLNGEVELNLGYADLMDGRNLNGLRIYGDGSDTVDMGDNGSRNSNVEGMSYQDNQRLIASNQKFWNKVNTDGVVMDDNGVEFNVWQYENDAVNQVWIQTDITII